MDVPDDAALRDKEEYYRKLNESLQSKAASLIAKAENALKEQTKVCDTFDLPPVEQAAAEYGRKPSLHFQSGESQSDSFHETYQAILQSNINEFRNINVSDSDDSLVEAFESLETNEGPDGQSATSLASKNLSGAAQARLYRAKLRVAAAELTRLKEQYDKLLVENRTLNDKCKGSERDSQRAVAGAQKHIAEISRLRQALEEANNQVQKFKAESASWKKDAENSTREAQAAAKCNSQTEVKLKRSNEEIERLKLSLETEKRRAKEATELMKEKVAVLETSNKQLEKQKQELIVGFKKQMKLVDVLKRQKLHLEGAKLLQISEEEFLKVVDLSLNE